MKSRAPFYLTLALSSLLFAALSPLGLTLKPSETNFHGVKAKPFEVLSAEDEPNHAEQLEWNNIGIGSTWNSERGEGVTLAVIDSGLDIAHEDFMENGSFLLSPDSAFVHDPTGRGNYTSAVIAETGLINIRDDDIYDEQYDEYYSHGTAASGSALARINGAGGNGVAPEATLLFIKTDFFFNSLERAIRYAADHGADVISMSLGAYSENFYDGFDDWQSGDSETATYLQSAIDYAYNKDCVIVAAAGNELTSHKSYPACNNHVIGVGALAKNSSTTASYYSNYNASSSRPGDNVNVDVAVTGTVYAPNFDKKTGDSSGYQETNGTSFACPITAGAIALYRSKYPEASNAQVEQALFASCDDIGDTGWDTTYGYGHVNVTSFLAAEPGVGPNPVTAVSFQSSGA
ncbi:MAG: S8 family serine peptidase, partial [Bacilli bacterium]|nr:S8 family serine peptidase [Bacilli bacterium]